MTGQELLLLDNDARIVELLSWFLADRGYGVRTASSFAEARAAIETARPDLLVSDIDLGSESAVQELPRLSAEGGLPPTLVVSGYLDAAVRERLLAIPEVIDTLAKPFEFSDLEAQVEACLRRAAEGILHVAAPRPGPQPAPRSAAEADPGPGSGPGSGSDTDADDDGWIEITPGP